MGKFINTTRNQDVTLLVIAMFAGSLVLGDYAIRFYIQVLNVDLPSQIVAGFTEPLTTKLLPAVAVLWVHRWKDVPADFLRSRPYLLAGVGGLSLGLFERALYILVKNASISPGFVIAPLIHVVNAGLIGGLLFAAPEENQDLRFSAKLAAVTILAIAIHLWWNGWGAYFVAENPSSVRLLAIPAGLIGAISALIALVAQFRFQPVYSWLVKLHPTVARYQAARDALESGRKIRLRDEREVLNTVHEVAAEEYDNIPEQYAPVEFEWFHNGFRIRFDDQSRRGKKNIPDIEQELLGHFDHRISRSLGSVAATGAVLAVSLFLLVFIVVLI